MKRYGWLVFFVLAVPAAIAAFVLGFEDAGRYPLAAANSEAMMRIVTLLVVPALYLVVEDMRSKLLRRFDRNEALSPSLQGQAGD